jgi:putative transposase
MRGWIKSEIGRCLNRLAKVRAPAKIIVTKLNFRDPGLSRCINKLLSDMVRGQSMQS